MSRLYNDESHHVLINWITPGPQAQITAYEHLTEAAYLLSFLRTKVDVQINKKRYGENDDTESSIDYTVDNQIQQHNKQFKHIVVSRDNYEIIRQQGQLGETFDQVIDQILAAQKKHKQGELIIS
jgi:hypothetical protein